MDSTHVADVAYLTSSQKAALKKGNVRTLADVVLLSIKELSTRCKISPLEATTIFNTICSTNSPQIIPLSHPTRAQQQIYSTGDTHLDAALGGGFRTGMVWEIFGQSAAGKTQFALQLSLMVQIPPDMGGLLGSACYITISSNLPTSRLLQMIEAHPQLSAELCDLESIDTIKCQNIPLLIRVLSKDLPQLISRKRNNSNVKPVRLVVVDALAELFRSDDKATRTTLLERSQNVFEISTLLHTLASTHALTVLVLNEVSDNFGHDDQAPSPSPELDYKQQSRWFGGADSVHEESDKEASLGLAWANQVNVRIMLSRTHRRRYIEDSFDAKRRKVDIASPSPSSNPGLSLDNDATLIRRLSVVFSSVSPPCSLDYIVTSAGLSFLPDDGHPLHTEHGYFPPSTQETSQSVQATSQSNMLASQVAPLDMGLAEHEAQSEAFET
ncbi:RAD51b protein [Favolaschia claudopus]|uniref:RAD51b protein n=1 Tax=Favolaschia claudopus TaxID=2862362 RepID=A0AAW0BCG9_9AGAR